MVAIRRRLVSFQDASKQAARTGAYKSKQAARTGVYKIEKQIVRICSLWTFFKEKLKQLGHVAKKIVTGSLNRITTGEAYTARFPMPSPDQRDLISLMERFTSYDLTSEGYYHSSPLSHQQSVKISEIVNRRDEHEVRMQRLLDRCNDPKFSRKKFDGEDVIALDRANFELVKDFVPDFVDFVNSGHFDSMQNDIQSEFSFDYYEAVLAEMLARTIAYNSHLNGETMPLPVLLADGTYGVAEFTIKSYNLGDELPAYVLECKDEEGNDLHAPWFVVRGTETSLAVNHEGKRVRRGGVESVMADFIHPEGVADGVVDKCLHNGKTYFEQGNCIAQPSLAELFQGRQFKLTGHSLGGALVNHITAHLYDNVEKAYGFSAPGVSDAVQEIWNSHIPDDSKLINIQIQGDAVPAAGKRLIGTHVAFTHLIKPAKAGAVHMHVLMCLTKPFILQHVDKEMEEAQTGRQFTEITRRGFGNMIRWASDKLSWQLPDWYVNRHIFQISLPNMPIPHVG